MGNQDSSAGDVEKRYYLQKVKLGAGSFGTVWRAVDRKTNSIVAIKQLDKSRMTSRGVKREDVDREIKMMRSCSHSNVLGLHETFEDQKFIYLALEYCGDGDLSDKIRERALRLQEPQAVEWMRQICSAISALHTTGICHRDIKPENFMLAGEELKLADFGLASFLPRGKMLTEKCGTPAFMSPEQHRLPKQSRGYGLPVDIWAAGISLYMLMTGGRHPFFDSRGHLDLKLLMQGSAVLHFSTAARQEQSFLSQLFEFEDSPGATHDRRFPDEARDLCKMMVQTNASTRITADGALRSPWLVSRRELPRREASTRDSAGAAPPQQRKSRHRQEAMPPVAPRMTPGAQPQPASNENAGLSSLGQGMNELGLAVTQAASDVIKGISGALDEPQPNGVTLAQKQDPLSSQVSNAQATQAYELMTQAQAYAQERILSAEATNVQLVADMEYLRTELSKRDAALAERESELAQLLSHQEEAQRQLAWQGEWLQASQRQSQFDSDQQQDEFTILRQELAHKERELAERDQELAAKHEELAQRDAKLIQLVNELNVMRSERRPTDDAAPASKCCFSFRRNRSRPKLDPDDEGHVTL